MKLRLIVVLLLLDTAPIYAAEDFCLGLSNLLSSASIKFNNDTRLYSLELIGEGRVVDRPGKGATWVSTLPFPTKEEADKKYEEIVKRLATCVFNGGKLIHEQKGTKGIKTPGLGLYRSGRWALPEDHKMSQAQVVMNVKKLKNIYIISFEVSIK